MKECPFPFLFKKLGIMPEHNVLVHTIEERENCEICQKIQVNLENKQKRWLKRFLKNHTDII